MASNKPLTVEELLTEAGLKVQVSETGARPRRQGR
jgi:hypothetical protein